MKDEETETTIRSKGELLRLELTKKRLLTTLESLDLAVKLGGFIGTDMAQQVAHTANDLAMIISRHDAYLFAEEDAAKRGT